jgi:hypothetical protein
MNITHLPKQPLQRLPDHVKIGIRTTVADQVVATGEPAPDANYTVCVGQIGQHLATCNVPILSVTWVLAGVNGVANYTATTAAGIVTPIAPTMLSGNPLIFAWAGPGACSVGVYIYTAYGTGYAQNNFTVTAPQVNFLEAATSEVQVAPISGNQFLQFGNQSLQVPGITINALVYGAQSVPGTLAIFQLCTNERFATDTDNRPWHWSLNGQSVLDIGMTGTVIYQAATDLSTPGASAQFDVIDSPGMELGPPLQLVAAGDGNPVVPETYNSYLMFQPAGGIWVPLSVLTWYWAGYSRLENGVWSAAQDPENSVDPLGVVTANFPIWTANTGAGAWVAG